MLSDRTHQFTVSATDAAGNVITSPTVVSVTVDTQPPGDPVILAATDDVGNAPIDLPSGSRSNDTLPELKGTGIAGSTITLYEGSTPIGSTTVLPAGTGVFNSANRSVKAHTIYPLSPRTLQATPAMPGTLR